MAVRFQCCNQQVGEVHVDKIETNQLKISQPDQIPMVDMVNYHNRLSL